MPLLDDLETNCGATVAEPLCGPLGAVTTYSDCKEWAYVLKDMREYLNRLVNNALGIQATDPFEAEKELTQQILDGVEHPPDVIALVEEVNTWTDSYPRWVADPDEFFGGTAWTTKFATDVLDDQLTAIRNGAPLVELAEVTTGVTEAGRPGGLKKGPERDEWELPDTGDILKVVAAVAIGGAFLYGFTMSPRGPGYSKT
jgi:hypothetical protein